MIWRRRGIKNPRLSASKNRFVGCMGSFIFFRLDAKDNETKRKETGISSASRRRADAGFLFLPLFADE